jgi:ketosteroid isomerase-like protein
MRLIIVCLLWFNFSCNFFPSDKEDITDNEKALIEMEQTDIAFSEYSRMNGMHNAFLHYIVDDGVLLQPNTAPIIGADAIQVISSMNDSSLQLTWIPSGGEVASSGDMGYTFGTFLLKSDSLTVKEGSYVTIWKKQNDGKWKFVLEKHD